MQRSLALGLVLSLCLAARAAAQSSERHTAFSRVRNPLRSATLDLATGTITRGPASANRGGTTIADFQNVDLNGFIGVDTGGGACKWFTAGLKGSGSNQSSNASDLMSSVVFAYCSNALDTTSGGPGGSATLGFYEGYTLGGGAPTTAVAVLTLTGLPANSIFCSFFGRACYLLTVNFGTLVAFRDSGPGGPRGIGYSWTFDDLDCGGVWAATYPFFACIASCSGTVGGVDGQGQTDFIDQYCPPGAAVPSTFTFGTTNPAWAPQTWMSVNMRIQEAADRLATTFDYNAALTPNGDTLTATTALIGGTWTATLTRAAPSVPASFVVRVRTQRSLPNGTSASPPATGRVLIAGPLLAQLAGTHDGSTGAVSVAVPLQLGFCGVGFAAQATTFGGSVALSSAVAGTVGTF